MQIRCMHCGTVNKCSNVQSNVVQRCANCGKGLAGELIPEDMEERMMLDRGTEQLRAQMSNGLPYGGYDANGQGAGVQKVGVGYYTKRLALIVIPFLAFLLLPLWKTVNNYRKFGSYMSIERLYDYWGEVLLIPFIILNVVVAIIISVQRRKSPVMNPFVSGYNYYGEEVTEFNVLIAIFDILLISGVLPVALPVAFVNTIRELTGKVFDYTREVQKIEKICGIVQIIVGSLNIFLLAFLYLIGSYLIDVFIYGAGA